MQEHSLSTLLGYDHSVLARLPIQHARQIARVAEAWLLSCALLASPLAYAVWLVEHSLSLAVLCGVGTFLLVLNMLRLVAAGGGAAPHFSRSQVEAYRPALGPTVLVGVLALLFAQPAQLPLWSQTLAEPVAAHRQTMIEQHERSLSALHLADDGNYQRELARCEFLVLRLTLLWQQPARAVRLTAIYLLLVLLPALGARMFALDSLRAYERARWERGRRGIVREAHAAQREVDALLSKFASFTPKPPHYADVPFNSRVLSPLLLPPPAKPLSRRRWWRRGGVA
jgi:hypothetical protein